MPNEDYSLGKLATDSRRYTTSTKNEEIRFVCWGGRMRINVTKKGELRAIYELTCSKEKHVIIRDIITKIIKASPGTRYPILFKEWDANERKFKPISSLSFVKDDKNVYHIELRYQQVTYEAIIRGPGDIDIGSTPMSDSDRSYYGILDLDRFIRESVPILEILTNKKVERPSGGVTTSTPSESSRSNEADDLF